MANVRFGYHGGTAMKPDYSRIPRHTLKTLEAWIATGAGSTMPSWRRWS